jgi:hypothetical protein
MSIPAQAQQRTGQSRPDTLREQATQRPFSYDRGAPR